MSYSLTLNPVILAVSLVPAPGGDKGDGGNPVKKSIVFTISTSNNNKIVSFVLLDPRLWRGLYVFKVLLPFVPLDSRLL